MQNADKGLLALDGRPLVAHASALAEAQAGRVLISANRHLERYREFGHPVLSDDTEGSSKEYRGPLAGMLAALNAAETPLLLTIPCDSPWLPADFGERLHRGLVEAKAELAVAGDGKRLHPVVSLMRTNLRDSLEQFMAEGQRKIDRWYDRIKVCHVHFDDERAFANLNTPEELEAAHKK